MTHAPSERDARIPTGPEVADEDAEERLEKHIFGLGRHLRHIRRQSSSVRERSISFGSDAPLWNANCLISRRARVIFDVGSRLHRNALRHICYMLGVYMYVRDVCESSVPEKKGKKTTGDNKKESSTL